MSAVLPTASDLLLRKIEMLIKLNEQLDQKFTMLCRMQGNMQTRKQMMERYDIGYATLNKRVAAKIYPNPGADGLWLLSEVVEFENEARR